MSLTPRDAYDPKTGKIVRKIHTQWLEEVAATYGVPFIDLNEISGEKLDRYSHWKEKYMFYVDLAFNQLTRYRQSIDAIMPLTKELKILGEYQDDGKQPKP